MKPNIWVSSSQATELLTKQLVTWPLAAKNFHALETVRLKSFDMDGFTVKVQFNPSRIISSAARTDTESLRLRNCFLCADNLPEEQEKLPFGFNYFVLCNPYPIFPQHFTIPSREHAAQSILPRFPDFLEMSRRMEEYVLFYNGPKCGASLPDHAHFQAATRSVMPMDDEVADRITEKNRIFSVKDGSLYLLKQYLRNGIVIQARTSNVAHNLFRKVYQTLEIKPGDTEPMMNLFSYYQQGVWTIIVIPRRQHRPRQYEAVGEERLVSSPGAADIGGLFITPREEDYDKMTPELLRDVYNQVCLSDTEVEEIANKLAVSSK